MSFRPGIIREPDRVGGFALDNGRSDRAAHALPIKQCQQRHRE
jgi:hypothetical protein